MPVQRMTAKKVRISELVNGNWVKKEGMEPSFVVAPSGEEISRARIMGTVVSRFLADDGNFASITLDDTTETIRLKTFKTTKPLDDFEIGNLVDVIGKVREYLGEIYILPEIVRKIEDPNQELLRKLEMVKKPGKSESGKQERGESEKKKPEPEKKGEEKGDDKILLKKEILKFIESGEDGVEYGQILENVKGKETEIESVVNEILAEGICYEPTPGKIKKI